jgi:hypothetical protein
MSLKTAIPYTLATVFGFALSAVLGYLDWIVISDAVNQVRAVWFPTVQGKMVKCKVTIHEDTEGTAYGMDAEYRYQVGNQNYTGKRIRYLNMWGDSSAKAFAQAHPVGSNVTVYHDPDDPSEAVLAPGFGAQELWLGMFLLPFNLVVIAGWSRGIHALLSPGDRVCPFGLRIRDLGEGDQIRVRLPDIPVAGPATVALLAGPIFFALCSALCSGLPPELSLMAVFWICEIVLLLWAGARIAYLLGSSKLDMVLDLIQRTLTLPATFRNSPMVIPLADIEAIEVITVKKPENAEDPAIVHAPTVRWRQTDGSIQQSRLAEWSSKERAESFATWLRVKVGLESAPVSV